MTTPERLKRRQIFIEILVGTFALVLGVLTVFQGIHFQHVEAAQRACIADNFQKLSKAVGIRAKLSEKETKAERAIWVVYGKAAGAIKDPRHPHIDPKTQAQLNVQLVHALLNYTKVSSSIQQDRRDHPVPPYPVGSCED